MLSEIGLLMLHFMSAYFFASVTVFLPILFMHFYPPSALNESLYLEQALQLFYSPLYPPHSDAKHSAWHKAELETFTLEKCAAFSLKQRSSDCHFVAHTPTLQTQK